MDVTNFDLAYLHLVITAVSGTTPRMILEVETSYDNSNWVHRRTICDKTTAGDNVTVTGDPVRGKLEATGTCICYIPEGLGKYIRLKGTLTGTSPSFTFSCYGSAS